MRNNNANNNKSSQVAASPSWSPPLPPLAPPLPSPPSIEKSSISLKVSSAPPGWAFEGKVTTPAWDTITPPAGLYFFYGTLQDPQMLKDILGLPTVPVLRPAHVMGYELKMWGQYPALVDGTPGALVKGSVWNVSCEDAAARLADYETNNYQPTPVNVFIEDGKPLEGYSFMFCGNPVDLDDGTFDLDVWLGRMGRKPATTG